MPIMPTLPANAQPADNPASAGADTRAAHTLTVRTDAGPLHLPAGATLDDAVRALLAAASGQESATSVATAVNGCFVPREARAGHLLHEGDHVLCFSPITGG